MNRKIHIGIAITASLLSATSVLAAESAGDAARRCAQILGERERLACFDRAFTAGPETAALAETRAAATAAPVAVAAPAAPAAASIAVPVAAASVATAATVAAAPTAVAPSLGDDQVRKYDKEAKEAKEATGEPKSLTAKVIAVKETREDTWRMNLDNGQVWQQMDMSSVFHPVVGDTVEVQRKMMGGYALALAGGKRSPWIRVTRLE
jgi:hypothetical protein